MPYRQIYLGDGETTIARVPDEVVEEWLINRERNKRIGYPDRPPDIDTPLYRSWINHPGDPGYEEMAAYNTASSGIGVYSAATLFSGVIEAKVLIIYNEEHGYNYRLVARSDLTGEAVIDKSASTEDWDEKIYEKLLLAFSELFIEEDSEVLVSTYFDFLEMKEETDRAFADLREYYGVH